MTAKNIYSNSLVTIPVTILEGETSSPYVSLTNIEDPTGQVAGKAELVAVILPANFPQGSNVFYSASFYSISGRDGFRVLANSCDCK